MKVSVVVPLFNKAATIERSLASICSQTHTDIEVFVIDDGSTDSSAEIADRFPDPRVRVIRQRNQGPGAARNRGIAEARGELIAFLDADDSWLPGYLSRCVAILERHPEALTATTSYAEEPGGSFSDYWRSRGVTPGLHRLHCEMSARVFLAMLAFMTPCTTVSRLPVLREIGGFDPFARYGEDAALWLRVLFRGPVYFDDEPLVSIDRAGSALSGNYTQARPVEPFLISDEPLRESCPPALRPLLADFLALRACKTAAVLGYWGDWRGAGKLVRRFVRWKDWRNPVFPVALFACTPLAGLAGLCDRKLGISGRAR